MPKPPLQFRENVKPWNGRRRPFERMGREEWVEKYGETPKTDHFTTDENRYAARASAENMTSVPPGPYHPVMKRAALKKWMNLQEMGMTPDTAYDYDMISAAPVANIKEIIHRHLKQFVKRAEEAGYEVKEVSKNPETKVLYAKICKDGVCTYQVIKGPHGTMSGGTRKRARGRRRGTRRLKN